MKIKILLIFLVVFSLLFAKKNENTTNKLYRAISESDLAKVKKLKEKGIDLSLPHYPKDYIHTFNEWRSRKVKENYIEIYFENKSMKIHPPRFHEYILINSKQFLHPTLKRIPHVYERTPLEIAVILGELEILKYFIEECNLHIKNHRYRQCLTNIAIQYGHLDVLKYLIENNRYIHFPTALFKALEFKHKEIAQYLLENYTIDVNYISNRGNSLLNAAISLHDLDYIHYIFNEKGYKIPEDEHARELILHKACSTNQDSIAFELIKTYNLPITNVWKYSPLVESYIKGYSLMFKYLVQHGADVNIRSKKEKYSLLHNWVEDPYKSLKIIKFLNNETNYDFYANDITGKNVLMSFAHRGYFEICRYLIENLNFNLNAQSLDGRNILTYIISSRSNEQIKYKFAEYLIEKGLNINTEIVDLVATREACNDGIIFKSNYVDKAQNPIIAASIYSNKKMIKLLLDNGAEINAEDYFGNTALDLVNGFFKKFYLKMKGAGHGNNLFSAVKNDDFSEVKRIVENGIDVNRQFRSGELALSYFRSYKVAKFLIQNGASVGESKNRLGSRYKKEIIEKIEKKTGTKINSDLLINSAIVNNDIHEVMQLIYNGYDVNKTNWLRQNPLYMAARMNNLEIIDTLLAYGAERILIPQLIISPPIDSITINFLDTKKVKFIVKNKTTKSQKRYPKPSKNDISMHSTIDEILSSFEDKYINNKSLNLLEEITFEKERSIFLRKLINISNEEKRKTKMNENNINLNIKDINGISFYFIPFQRRFKYNRHSKFVLNYAEENYSAIDQNGANIFMYASQSLPFDEFKELMKNYNFDINYKDFEDRTILDYAQYAHFRTSLEYKENFWSIINYLCKLGANRGAGVEYIPPIID